MMSIVSKNSTGLNGKITVAGDKSISHRALMFGAIAKGTTKITGLLCSEDVMNTLNAVRMLGADVVFDKNGVCLVTGTKTLKEPENILDMGNAGTATRLLAGLVSTHPITCFFTGDSSLRSRPMNRIIEPLSKFGAVFKSRKNGKLPLCVCGAENPTPVFYRLPVASAQVKSAVLLAGLNTDGQTVVEEPVLSRDHTERMLQAFGVPLEFEPSNDGGRKIILNGKASLKACDVVVPADISSAAFPLAAALITPDSDVTVRNVGVNPLRTGVLTAFKQMGANIRLENEKTVAGESVADIHARFSPLTGADFSPDLAPSMIDEYPILAVVCAFAKGQSRLRGLSELKVKESDRFSAILNGLKENGVKAFAQNDDIFIEGTNHTVSGGGLIHTNLDHRVAMSFAVMGMAAKNAVTIDDASAIATSFPNFIDLMNRMGANIS